MARHRDEIHNDTTRFLHGRGRSIGPYKTVSLSLSRLFFRLDAPFILKAAAPSSAAISRRRACQRSGRRLMERIPREIGEGRGYFLVQCFVGDFNNSNCIMLVSIVIAA